MGKRMEKEWKKNGKKQLHVENKRIICLVYIVLYSI
jgi:hypothetical protein